MTAYEKELLALAVENCGGSLLIEKYPDSGPATWSVILPERYEFQGETLADAIAEFLRAFHVEVPERPSAERVAKVRDEILDEACDGGGPLDKDTLDAVAYHPDRLAVLALLEGGDA